jgi:hypothetical protein
VIATELALACVGPDHHLPQRIAMDLMCGTGACRCGRRPQDHAPPQRCIARLPISLFSADRLSQTQTSASTLEHRCVYPTFCRGAVVCGLMEKADGRAASDAGQENVMSRAAELAQHDLSQGVTTATVTFAPHKLVDRLLENMRTCGVCSGLGRFCARRMRMSRCRSRYGV